jgi:hypothetical protein
VPDLLRLIASRVAALTELVIVDRNPRYFMIAKGLIPGIGTKSFAIMETPRKRDRSVIRAFSATQSALA